MLAHKHSKPQLKMKAHLTSSFAPYPVRQNHPHQIQNSCQYKFQMSILEENFYSKYFLQTCILSHIGLLYSIKVNVPEPITLAATFSGEQVFENVQRANQASPHTLLNQVDQQRKSLPKIVISKSRVQNKRTLYSILNLKYLQTSC